MPLSDLAADARASTPTAAARLVVPDLAELTARLDRSRTALARGARGALERERRKLDLARDHLCRAPLLLVERRRAALEHAAGRLRALSPRATLERGYAISFAGNVTYPSARALADAARAVPTEALLAETDAPYLTPQAVRKRRNQPAFVAHTVAFLAQLRGAVQAELGDAIAANAARVFAW